MNKPPEYILVGNNKYKINTDFRVALKCDEIDKDESISDYEKVMAIIYLLFGEQALNDTNNYDKLMELALKYLNCDRETVNDEEEPDMDFEQDYAFIKASFRTDYGINLDNEEMHWWDFYSYLNGLKEDCVLNRIRSLRTCDLKDYKGKERKIIEKQKEKFALKKKAVNLTEKQKQSANKFFELTGIKRRQ